MMEKEGLYLSEILERDKVEFDKDNLILAPKGSGKTHFIINTLGNEYNGRVLMLVSKRLLEDPLDDEEESFICQDSRREMFEIADSTIDVMSHEEFGKEILWELDFAEEYDLFLCDDIESMFQYYPSELPHVLGKPIEFFFFKPKDAAAFHFAETIEDVDMFVERELGDANRNIFEGMKVVDYREDSRIAR